MADRTLRVAPRPEVHHARSFTFMGRFLHVETFSNLRAPQMLSRIWLFATLSSAAVSGMDWQIQLSNDTAKRSLECRRRNAALLTKSNRVIFSRLEDPIRVLQSNTRSGLQNGPLLASG